MKKTSPLPGTHILGSSPTVWALQGLPPVPVVRDVGITLCPRMGPLWVPNRQGLLGHPLHRWDMQEGSEVWDCPLVSTYRDMKKKKLCY